MNGSGLKDSNSVLISSQQFHEDLRGYFRRDAFEIIMNPEEMYSWLETHLNDRLYLPVGRRSPNRPIGATRMIQYRVKVNKTCVEDEGETGDETCHDKFDKGDMDTIQLEFCLEKMYSEYCNPPFVPKDTEQGFPQEFDHLQDIDDTYVDENEFKMFEPIDSEECAGEDCSEFMYQQQTLTRSFTGKHGSYPDRGYFIDFTSNKAVNQEKINKLKSNKWIDQDTRGVQILWTIHSSWS